MALSCREFGTTAGPTILFVHDAGLGGWQWEPVGEALPEYHCLAVDLPGHGTSGGKPFRTLDLAAAALIDVIRHQTRRKVATVVGTGIGARILLHLMANHPGRAVKAVLAHLPDPERQAPWTLGLPRWLRRLPPVVGLTARALAVPETAFARWQQESSHQDPDSVRRAFASAQGMPDGLAAVTVPTLILAGEWEGADHRLRSASLARTLRNGCSGVLRGEKPPWPLGDATSGAAVVRAWIEGSPLPEAIGEVRAPERVAVEQPAGPPDLAEDDEGDWWEDV